MAVQNNNYVAGVDEAGRGPLAGPVYAAAVILPPGRDLPGLADSKALTQRQREDLAEKIQTQAVAWAVAWAEVQEIDQINILRAALLAMRRAVNRLTVRPRLAMIDGDHAPELHCTARTIIKGDVLEPAISAAAILAKAHRDRLMVELDQKYPEYGLARNKGYATKFHLAALRAYGATPIHRRSFAPVRAVLARIAR